MQQPPGEQRYRAESKAAGSFSVGGSRPQASKLAKNRIRLYLTLARAGRAFHQMSTANHEQSSQGEGRGAGVCLQMAKTFCAWLETAHTADWLELTQRDIQKPSEGALSGIPEVTDDYLTSSATSIPVLPLNCLYFKLPTAV